MTPARKAVLDRMLPASKERERNGMLEWEFDQPLQSRWRRRYVLRFHPSNRSFSVYCRRRPSKRSRNLVSVSAGMIAYLRSRLSPSDIARCTAAAVTYQPNDDLPF